MSDAGQRRRVQRYTVDIEDVFNGMTIMDRDGRQYSLQEFFTSSLFEPPQPRVRHPEIGEGEEE